MEINISVIRTHCSTFTRVGSEYGFVYSQISNKIYTKSADKDGFLKGNHMLAFRQLLSILGGLIVKRNIEIWDQTEKSFVQGHTEASSVSLKYQACLVCHTGRHNVIGCECDLR